MNVLIWYFVIALIVFAVLDYFYANKNDFDVYDFIFVSVLWIILLVGLVIAMPFYVIHKLIKRNNKL